ncbi:MAG: NTP transferase domain-containing protein [Bacteroidia bacterium]|nr:NTP transferase domain-containing protein [Bacteroidia bacterium]
MKIIIPVAGIGSKLRPHTHTQPKALVPVAGKPILSHIVDYLIAGGFNEFVFIIGYLGDKIEDYVKSKYPKLKASFVIQEPREGTGHAVWLARDYVQPDEELLIVLGDTIIDFELGELMKMPYSALGLQKVDDPRQFGVAEVDKEGFITRLEEKPVIPKSNQALVGIYRIKEAGKLMDALDYIIRNNVRHHGEFHLTYGIQRMISQGEKVSTFRVGNWFDCGSKANLLETNAVLLRKHTDSPQRKYNFHNTIIIPPVSIAEHCDISDSIIGPNVSIGEHTIIRHSIIRDSIIGAYAHLETAILHHSIVGSDAFLKGLSQSLNIGDSTEIDFS